MKGPLGNLRPDDARLWKCRINRAKEELEEVLRARREAIQQKELEAQLAEERLDVTLPGRGLGTGGLHP